MPSIFQVRSYGVHGAIVSLAPWCENMIATLVILSPLAVAAVLCSDTVVALVL